MTAIVRAIVPLDLAEETDALSAVAAAVAVAGPAGARVEALVIGGDRTAEARELGADSVERIGHIDELCGRAAPLLTLLPAGAGTDIAATLAMRLDGTALGRCDEIRLVEGGVIALKTAFGGRMRATVSAGPNSFATLRVPRTRFATAGAPSPGARALEGARVVVSGGRGMGGPEGFALLQQLADALGGALGGSLPTVDAGWVPVARQVGQSGKYVEPDVYVAVGISGTPQHLAGIGPGTRIVAINKDPEADIFRVAELGLVGDWQAVLPALVEQVRAP